MPYGMSHFTVQIKVHYMFFHNLYPPYSLYITSKYMFKVSARNILEYQVQLSALQAYHLHCKARGDTFFTKLEENKSNEPKYGI